MIFIDILYVIMSILKGVKTSLSLFIILSFLSFFMIDIILIIVYKKKRNNIEAGLLQAIVIMNSAFKSGKNIWQAINIVKTSTESPIKEEFEIISKDIDYGLDLLTVFERFYNRVKVEEVKYITTSLSLLNKTGGIVQGMSGSPIIQGDNIVGSVTHVVVDNPEKGYGIYITNMLTEAEK